MRAQVGIEPTNKSVMTKVGLADFADQVLVTIPEGTGSSPNNS